MESKVGNKTVNVFTFPRNVLNGLDAYFSLPSLSELSYLAGGLPPESIRKLQQVDIFNIAGIRVSPGEKRLPRQSTHCKPRTLRFWDEHSLSHLLSPKYNPPIMTLERLTTLIFASSILFTPSTMMIWLKSCSSTLTDLKIFFNDWRMGPGEQANSRILDPKVFTALKEVTFGFNLSDFWDTDVHPDQPPEWPSAPTPHERIEWIVEVLRIFAHSGHSDTALESLHLFIGTMESGIEMMDSLPWELFQALFSLDSLALEWPTLSRIHINFLATQDEEGTKLTPSQAAFIEQVLRLRLADLLKHGPFRLFVQGSKLEPPSFDPFLEYATRICSEPYDFDLD
ncbi:hypothetical protein BDZ97DRAFT_100832 [Flammula alnicola]|nr:hypothetical protein BDZ97DRAFT_100832 [Flammula alnicola]